jgi:hypothetical protein
MYALGDQIGIAPPNVEMHHFPPVGGNGWTKISPAGEDPSRATYAIQRPSGDKAPVPPELVIPGSN